MKQTSLHTFHVILFLLTLVMGPASHVAILVSGMAHGPLFHWRLLGFGLMAGTAVSYLVWRWWWGRQQAKCNGAARLLFAIAPRPQPGPVVCDFWRRFPSSYLPRRWGQLPCGHVSLEIGGDSRECFFSATLPALLRQALLGNLAQEWPKSEVRPLADSDTPTGDSLAGDHLLDAVRRGTGAWRWHTFKLKEPDHHPLHRVEPPRYGQPRLVTAVSGMLAAMHNLPAGTVGGIQVLVRPAPANKRWGWVWRINLIRRQLANRGSRSQTIVQPGENGSGARQATSQQFGPLDSDALTAELARLTQRLGETPLYEVCLRVWARGDQAEAEARRLAQQVQGWLYGSWNQLEIAASGDTGAEVIQRRFPVDGGIVLTAVELGQLMHLPDAAEAAPYVRLRQAGAEPLAPEGRVLVAAATTTWEAGGRAQARVYGLHDHSAGEQYVGHSFADATTHTFIVGATGAGKSVLGANLALQDWLAGQAVLVLDPHRSLIDDILRGVPVAREPDVILLDPGDARQPFRFNLFDAGQGEETAAVERLLAALRVGMEASWESSVGMQEVLHHALTLTLRAARPDMLTLAGLLEEETRAALLETIRADSPRAQQALHFWQKQFPTWNGPDQKRALAAARRRVENFTRRDLVRRALGQAGTTVDLAAALNGGKLILCPMHNEMGTESKRIWSALLLQEVIALLLARDPQAALPRVTVVVDELAESVGTLAGFVQTLLNETRKYGAAVVLLNQSYVSLPPEVRQVVLANCRSHVALSLGAEDAAVAARVMGSPVTAEDVQHLRPYHAYARLAVSGGQAAPCQIRTLPPLPPEAAPPKRLKPVPPAEIGELLSGIRPGRSAGALTPEAAGALAISDLLSWTRAVAPGESAAVGELLEALAALPEAQYQALIARQRQSDEWWWGQLVAQPGAVRNKARRIRMLSRLRYGIPWWQSDADYLRQAAAAAAVAAQRKAAIGAAKQGRQSPKAAHGAESLLSESGTKRATVS